MFKFAFVRNPWARMVSAYCYKFPSAATGEDFYWPDHFSFQEFLEKLDEPIEEGRYVVHGLNCLDWICDENGELIVDFVGRLENLSSDMTRIAERLDLPLTEEMITVKNKSSHQHYTQYYNDETRRLVERRFERDIEYFGYKFGE